MLIKRRFPPRKALVKQMRDEFVEKFGNVAGELLEGIIEIVELQDGREVVLVNQKPVAFRTSIGMFPTLHAIERVPLKRVTVDMGAVSHVAGGADIMAPGIVATDEGILVGDCVVIVDERHGKALAIGSALVEGASMKGPKGRVVKNLHHVGDEIWQFSA